MPLFRKSELSLITKTAGIFDAKKVLLREAAEFDEAKEYDIFLSHSYRDADNILCLKKSIEGMGFSTYVDWIEDDQLDRSKVTKDTAKTLRKRIIQCKCLLYVPSENSSNSKWMPWELGFADGKKNGMAAILPILSTNIITDEYKEQEYLGLYYYITKAKPQGGSNETLWVRESNSTYIIFSEWLKGKLPTKH